VIEAVLTTWDGGTFRDVSFLVPPVRLDLPDARVRVVNAVSEGSDWLVSLTADRLAYGVRLSVERTGARFSKNFFHLLAGDTATVRVTPEVPIPDLPGRLRLRWLSPEVRPAGHPTDPGDSGIDG
jgi:beta-mannosidase